MDEGTDGRCEPSHDLVEGWLGDSPEAAARRFRDVLGRFASGVTVVTSLAEGVPVGLTCQSFASLSLDPPLVVFAPSRTSRAWPRIHATGRFAVNVLGVDQQVLSNQMAGSGEDKFAGVEWEPSPTTGAPLLAGAVAWVDCTIEAVHPGGDHEVVVGRVVDLDLGADTAPLLFHRGAYRSIGPADPGSDAVGGR